MTSKENRNGEMRLEILKSAAAAFRRRGYYGASVDEIASALHMTKGNLYYYFKDKEDIFFCLPRIRAEPSSDNAQESRV